MHADTGVRREARASLLVSKGAGAPHKHIYYIPMLCVCSGSIPHHNNHIPLRPSALKRDTAETLIV